MMWHYAWIQTVPDMPCEGYDLAGGGSLYAKDMQDILTYCFFLIVMAAPTGQHCSNED
jgi:hypothetical protein